MKRILIINSSLHGKEGNCSRVIEYIKKNIKIAKFDVCTLKDENKESIYKKNQKV